MTRILVVEDDPGLREVLGEIMADWGLEVATCESGNQAIRRLGEESFDVILSDVSMPDGNGVTLLHWVLAQPAPRTPIILMTAMDAEFGRLANEGAFAVVGKPCSFDDLRALIASAAR